MMLLFWSVICVYVRLCEGGGRGWEEVTFRRFTFISPLAVAFKMITLRVSSERRADGKKNCHQFIVGC